MRICRARAAVLAALLCAGCAHRGLEPVAATVPAPGVAGESGRQALFRVRYRGLDGRGRIRLTVRVDPAAGFQLAAADVFGRQLWSFSGGAGQSLLLDHRRREVCHLDGDIIVQAIALNELPISLLPSVLLGELPFDAKAGESSGPLDHTDGAGRRWTARLGDDGRPERWALRVEGKALIWWQATDEGAILSHRGGAQVIWTVVADEPLDGPMTPLEEPAGYDLGQCDEPDVS